MASPVVDAVVHTNAADAGGTFVIDLPANIPIGNLILIDCGYYHANNYDPTLSGYTLLFDGFNTGGLFAFYRIADGSEGATVSVTGVNGSFAASAYSISGFDNTSPYIEASAIAYQAGSSSIGELDAPAVTASWGASDNLFMTIGLVTRNPTSWDAVPAGYTGQEVWSTADGNGYSALIYTGYKAASTATDDPGTYQDGTFKQYTAVTIAIRGVSTSPQITIDSDLVPGAAFAGTYVNMASIASPITLTDSQSNQITVAVTDNGDGTFGGTMPALPTSGTAQTVLFGSITVTASEA